MNNDFEQFHNVLEKFELVEPVSTDVRRHIGRIKKEQFKKTLKRSGRYSPVFILVSYIFFTLKKMGLSITIVKSAAIFAVSTSVATLSIATGTYYTVKHLTEPEVKPEPIEEIDRVIEDEKVLPGGKTDI